MPILTPGARLSMIDQSLIDRISGRLQRWITGGAVAVDPVNPGGPDRPAFDVPAPNHLPAAPPGTWMGPNNPMTTFAPPQDVAGRQFDYPASYNIGSKPRQYEGTTFEELRAFADGYDLCRLAIETRKDQFEKLIGNVLPRMHPGERVRQKADDRCKQLDDFLRHPDQKTPRATWTRLALEEVLVTDALSIYIRRTRDKQPYALELVDGATIRPLIDQYGRRPDPPTPAYQQILKGIDAIHYTADELLYFPRNRRVNHVYGMPPVQQVLMTINIAIRREVSKLESYTEGNIPRALISVPDDWKPDQISRFQETFDALMQGQQIKRRAYFVPGKMNAMLLQNEQQLLSPEDEWMARVIMYAFSLPVLPFVRMQNRATADSAYESAIEEGLMPLMEWFKGVMDHIVQKVFGYEDLEWVWEEARKVDPAEQEQRDMALVRIGGISIDDMRAARGMPPLGIPPMMFGIGPLGVISMEALKKAIEQGLDMPQAPMPAEFGMPMGGMPPGGMMAPGGLPPAGGSNPRAAEALRGIPADLLAQVGLGPPADPALAAIADAEIPPEAAAHMEDLITDAVSQPMSVSPAVRRSLSNPKVVKHPALHRILNQAERQLGRRSLR